VDGVVSTRPGWHASGEVVEVEYDPRAVTLDALTAAAKKAGARLVAKGDGERIRTDDDKYYLSRTPLRFVPMTPLQATRVNARVGKGLSLDGWLSPSQRRLLEAVKKHPDADWPPAIGADFLAAWTAAEKVREGLEK
jgi:hypothetical protein